MSPPEPSSALRDRLAGWISDLPLRGRDYAILLALGVGIRVAFAATAGLTQPVGEDLEFWAYRALELGAGVPFGTHPPLYPASFELLHRLGVPRLWAGAALAALAGISLAPAAAWMGAQVGGGRVARVVGALALTWPAITAWSMRVEPTAPFLVALAVVFGLTALAARDGKAAPAAAAGFGAFLLVLTKESGLVAFVPVLAALAASGPGRGRRLGVAVVAFGVPLAVWIAAEALSVHGGVAAKASLPLRDTLVYVLRGDIPPPMRTFDDPWGLVPESWVAGRAGGGPGQRVALYALIEALRWLRQLGLWGPVAFAASALVVREARAGRLAAWPVALALAAQLPLLLAGVLLVQGRHAETGLVGTAIAIGLLATTPARCARIADLFVVLGLQGALFLYIPEATRAGTLVANETDADLLADWVSAYVRPEDPLCTTSYRLAVALDRPARRCWNRGAVPAGPFFAVVNQETELDELGAIRPARLVATATDRFGRPWQLLHARDALGGRATETQLGGTPTPAPQQRQRPRYRDFQPR